MLGKASWLRHHVSQLQGMVLGAGGKKGGEGHEGHGRAGIWRIGIFSTETHALAMNRNDQKKVIKAMSELQRAKGVVLKRTMYFQLARRTRALSKKVPWAKPGTWYFNKWRRAAFFFVSFFYLYCWQYHRCPTSFFWDVDSYLVVGEATT